MAAWTGKAASVVMVFIATWAGAIIYWRSSGSAPSGMDMLLYLGLLPAGVSSAGVMMSGLVRHAANGAANATGAERVGSLSAADGAERADSPASVALLAAHINLGIGLDAATLLAVSQAPPRPALSTRFRDAQGLPVRISAADELDELEVIGEREHGIDTAASERRALALLSSVLDELLSAVAFALPSIDVSDDVVVAGLRRNNEVRVENVLTIELLLGQGWSDALRHWLHDWLTQRAIELGIDARRFDVAIRTMYAGGEVWRHVRQQTSALAGDAARWHLLLACDSSIDANVIQTWQSMGVLATPADPDGKTPGEGAAGVLLASPSHSQAQSARLWQPFALADDTAEVKRPAERRRRLAGEATQWTQTLALDGQSVQFVQHDAVHDSDSVVDAALVAAALNPDLDFSAASLSLAACSGELGPVLPLAQLALALEWTQTHAEAVVVLAGTQAQQSVLTMVSAGFTHQAAAVPSTT